MTKYVVISAFQDKNTMVHYPIGEAYESDDSERICFLHEEGFLGDEIKDSFEQELPMEPEEPQEPEEPNLPEKKSKSKSKSKEPSPSE